MKKKKTFLIPIFAVGGFQLLVIIFCVVLIFYNPTISIRMTKFYSDNKNFHHYKATIKDFSKTGGEWLKIDNILPLEKDDHSNFMVSGETVLVHSTNIDYTWELLAPENGLEFEFMGSFRVFFDGCPGAIVQITIDGEEILSFDDGKEALLSWAKTIR